MATTAPGTGGERERLLGVGGFAAAVGLVKTVVGTILVLAANRASKWFGQEGAF